MYGPVQHSYISFWNVRRSGAISLVLWELRLWNFNTIWTPYLCISWQKIINMSSIEREKWLPDHLTSEMGYTCVSWPIQLRELNSYLVTKGGRGAAPRCSRGVNNLAYFTYLIWCPPKNLVLCVLIRTVKLFFENYIVWPPGQGVWSFDIYVFLYNCKLNQ